MKTYYQRFIDWLITKPKQPLALIAAVTLIFAVQLMNLRVDATPFFIPSDHPSRIANEDVKSIFENAGQQAVITLEPASGTVFDTHTLTTIDKICDELSTLTLIVEKDHAMAQTVASTLRTDALSLNPTAIAAAIQYVEQHKNSEQLSKDQKKWLRNIPHHIAPTGKILCLTNVENLTADSDTLIVSPLIEPFLIEPLFIEKPQSSAEILENTKQAALANPLFVNTLINKEATATNIQIEFTLADDDSPGLLAAYKALTDITDRTGFNGKVYLSGQPIIASQLDATMERDNSLFFPIVILLVSISLYLSFNKFLAVAIPLTISLITIIWTFGTMALAGVEINIVSTSLPVFLMTIAVSDSVHFISIYSINVKKGLSRKEALRFTFNQLWLALLMTSLTTALGFLALANTNLTIIQEFGIFVAIGVMYAFIITVMVLLPWLATGKVEKSAEKSTVKSDEARIVTLISEGFIKFNRVLFQHKFKTAALYAALFSVSIFYASKVTIEYETIGSFKETTRIYQDDKAVIRLFGGSLPANLWLKSENENAFIRPDTLAALDKIIAYIETQPEVSSVTSPLSLLKRINDVLNNDGYRLPNELSQSLVSQYFLMYELGNGSELRKVADTSYKNARVIIYANADKATTWQSLIARVSDYSKSVLPSDVSVEFTGAGELVVSNILEVTHGQVQSLTTAILLIGILMTVIFRSIAIGIIALIPTLFTLAANFSLMTLFNLPMDIGASLVSGIALGVGIDYAIHFFSHLKECMKRTSFDSALEETLRNTSGAIIVNSIALALGFSVLMLSDYSGLRYLGLLITTTMLVCALLTLVTLPVIIKIVKPKALFAQSAETLPGVEPAA